MPAFTHISNDLGAKVLKEVSRSFYLTLRVLPGAVRPSIGLAYILARATDTIADTEIVPWEKRIEALRAYGGRIQGKSGALDLGALANEQTESSEKKLLDRTEEILGVLHSCPEFDRRLIQAVLHTIVSGQELDLTRFARADAKHIVALTADAELDDYTYRVAGCVGEFWTRICRAKLFPKAKLDETALLRDAVRFGQGLQLVNILRDLPSDLRQGRCYLPEPRLAEINLKPEALLLPENEPRFRPLYGHYLDRAWDHLAAGWNYTNTLPKSSVRVRLACAWPILIGVKTIERLRAGNVLDASVRIKVTRAEVKSVMLRTALSYPWPPAWRRLFPADSKP